jgi:NAD(P)H-hydrate epimerase
MHAVTAEQMAEIDRRAQEEYGISQQVLMENAGRSVAELIIADSGDVAGERIAVFCGKGNNGGDGFVAARYLADAKPARLTVYVLDAEGIRPGAALDNFRAARDSGLDIRSLSGFDYFSEGPFTIMIDAIFGTGFKGELGDEHKRIARDLKNAAVRSYAVDVPSGLNATTGKASKDCFKADKTITFGLPKRGFFMDDGPDVCGEVVVAAIGFPRELLEEYGGA